LRVTSPQPASLIYCVLNINLLSTYMLLVTASHTPQAHKSEAVSQRATRKNSSAFPRAQPCLSLVLSQPPKSPSQTAEGLTTALSPREGSWCTLSLLSSGGSDPPQGRPHQAQHIHKTQSSCPQGSSLEHAPVPASSWHSSESTPCLANAPQNHEEYHFFRCLQY